MHLYLLANAGLLAAEGFAAATLAFAVALGGTLPGLAALGAGIGAYVAASTMNEALVARTGAMLTPGGVLAHMLCWLFRLVPRRYYFSASLIREHRHTHKALTPPPLIIGDVVAALLYCAAQFGGAMLGVLLARELDHSGLLAASVNTAPFANLAGRHATALLAAAALNTFVLLLCVGTKAQWFGARFAQLAAPRTVGLAMGGAVMLSYLLGVGSTLSYATDLALAILVTQHYSPLWWVSGAGQAIGALIAFAVCWCYAMSDELVAETVKADDTDAQHMHPAHSRHHHHSPLASAAHDITVTAFGL